MKRLMQRILNGILSLITTFLIMASPVAAVVYAAEPTAAIDSFSLNESALTVYTQPAKNHSKPLAIYDENDELLRLTFSAK